MEEATASSEGTAGGEALLTRRRHLWALGEAPPLPYASGHRLILSLQERSVALWCAYFVAVGSSFESCFCRECERRRRRPGFA